MTLSPEKQKLIEEIRDKYRWDYDNSPSYILEKAMRELAQSLTGEGAGDSRDTGDEHRATKIMVQFAANFSELTGESIGADGTLFGGLKKEILEWVKSIRKMNRIGEEARKAFYARGEEYLRNQVASLESQLSALKSELEEVRAERDRLFESLGWTRAEKCGPDTWHLKGFGFATTENVIKQTAGYLNSARQLKQENNDE